MIGESSFYFSFRPNLSAPGYFLPPMSFSGDSPPSRNARPLFRTQGIEDSRPLLKDLFASSWSRYPSFLVLISDTTVTLSPPPPLR